MYYNFKQTLLEFGYDCFRPGQEEILESLVNKKNVLNIMPTGQGKSLIFQVYSRISPGITIVVTPLFALMEDQVEFMKDKGKGVALINSLLTANEIENIKQKLRDGNIKLLFVSPEIFDNQEIWEIIEKLHISLFVIDDAQYVSQWSNGFKPSYLRLGNVLKRLNYPQTLAMTSITSPWIRKDIIEKLNLNHPNVFVYGTNRPNIFYQVFKTQKAYDDRDILYQMLISKESRQLFSENINKSIERALSGSGIIFSSTLKGAEENAKWLKEWNVSLDSYHSRKAKEEKVEIQSKFMLGEIKVINLSGKLQPFKAGDECVPVALQL